MTTTTKERAEVLDRIMRQGVTYPDANSLRRIALTLRRWFTLECGDSNNAASWAIVRGRKEGGAFIHDDDGKPFIERHYYHENKPRYSLIPDRETGARKRLAALLAKYPGLHAYIQTDPRGASLYLLTAEQVAHYDNKPLEQIYNNGIAVY